ncbi:hypothetical protein HH214_19290 [Mucilaginibacter robiniae]|uniref:Uncharacterized protein n=1 Tax=Mucilaginibacter robiniae TaxID=2728022 RepID=A0A7L5E656_9SPHI|nr:hypothetical protein [Mucilaginibacter robiniae]QJD97867.1 hypothetical protein HH214_19290 [Mucilaginibacter robiniae]
MGNNVAGHTGEHKGQPSGNKKESSGLKDAFAGTDPELDKEIAAEYTKEGDEVAENVHILHHNRNANKGDSTKDLRK